MRPAFRGKNGKRGSLELIEGKNTRIPMYDAGDGKVLLAYYVEGRRILVKCQSLEAGRKSAKQIMEDLTSGTGAQRTLFGFESGAHWKRWQATAREAARCFGEDGAKSVFLPTAELNPTPGR
jgi:hypothetical protein